MPTAQLTKFNFKLQRTGHLNYRLQKQYISWMIRKQWNRQIDILTPHCINKQPDLLIFTVAYIFYTWPGVCIVRKKNPTHWKNRHYPEYNRMGWAREESCEKLCTGTTVSLPFSQCHTVPNEQRGEQFLLLLMEANTSWSQHVEIAPSIKWT